MKILLASTSARRQQLLAAAGLAFEIFSPEIDETPAAGEAPRALVRRLAFSKADAGVAQARAQGCDVVIAADTVVALGARVLNKPGSDAEARAMLRLLSGAAQRVYTGYAVARLGARQVRWRRGVVGTTVKFRALSRRDIDAYVATGEGRDKAGGYAIQGEGAALVERVVGSYTNVIGLPLAEVLACLR